MKGKGSHLKYLILTPKSSRNLYMFTDLRCGQKQPGLSHLFNVAAGCIDQSGDPGKGWINVLGGQ